MGRGKHLSQLGRVAGSNLSEYIKKILILNLPIYFLSLKQTNKHTHTVTGRRDDVCVGRHGGVEYAEGDPVHHLDRQGHPRVR